MSIFLKAAGKKAAADMERTCLSSWFWLIGAARPEREKVDVAGKVKQNAIKSLK